MQKQPHVLVAVDQFNDAHLQRIADTVAGWATWERIPRSTPEPEYVARLTATEIVIGWPKPDWVARSPVRVLQVPSAGYDEYLGAGLDQKPRFTLCNGRGVVSIPVAEHCVAMMLALARRLPRHFRDMELRRWNRTMDGYRELTGARVCIVGLGDIGVEIARRCSGLGMTVTGVRRRPSAPPGDAGVSAVYPVQELRTAVAEADHVVLALPGGPETTNLFDVDLLDAMKPGACVYNVSRGTVLEMEPLVARLRSGHLGGAALDVFPDEPLPAESPLWEMDNVAITPHVGGKTPYIAERLCDLVVTNLNNYRENRPLVNVVVLN